MTPVRCLSIHADYGCRHSGACCNAGWPIPIEETRQRALDAARRSGRLILPLRADDRPETCIFYEPAPQGQGGLCAIHRQLGQAMKPPSCRHFPRIALLDARGVSLTLSHFCPTAAAMLFRPDVPLRIDTNPPAFGPEEEYEGLDARAVMPPLLRPGLLWDLEGYTAWEEQAVAVCGRPDLGPDDVLDVLAAAAGDIEAWQPGADPLAAHVIDACRRGLSAAGNPAHSSRWGDQAPVVNRYLAARLFASWVPYRTERLMDLLDDLRRTLHILEEESRRQPLLDAFRNTDLRVVHAQA